MVANISAQIAVMKNLEAGLSPTRHLKSVSEIMGYRVTLASLVKKRWVEVDAGAAGRVRLTAVGRGGLARLTDKR
jgi:hypothetical protein